MTQPARAPSGLHVFFTIWEDSPQFVGKKRPKPLEFASDDRPGLLETLRMDTMQKIFAIT